VIFRSSQGKDTTGNLVALCLRCHDLVHGKVDGESLTILAKSGKPEDAPDADVGLKFVRGSGDGK
jgi:HNH endonuclease